MNDHFCFPEPDSGPWKSGERQRLTLPKGEELACAHVKEGAAGPGRLCVDCGAVLAVVGAISSAQPTERDAALAVVRAGKALDVMLRVRAIPPQADGELCHRLFAEDITLAHWRASPERTFFHDINNALMALLGAVDLLHADRPGDELVEEIGRAGRRIAREVEMQRLLSSGSEREVVPQVAAVPCHEVANSLRRHFATQAVARGRTFRIASPVPDRNVWTDEMFLERVLQNMLTNAFEATSVGGEVRFQIGEAVEGVRFEVWSAAPIAPELQPRLFQRHFSTKGSGRGFGTHSMKLFGERFLHGEVGFTSWPSTGTTFWLALPWTLDPETPARRA